MKRKRNLIPEKLGLKGLHIRLSLLSKIGFESSGRVTNCHNH
jgi:hypothetical protein